MDEGGDERQRCKACVSVLNVRCDSNKVAEPLTERSNAYQDKIVNSEIAKMSS